ncbi:hypothetical protein J6590_038109 [Homalodisca vitripennis]|nr:hypothetical protein J6590_038109 [Homalodisca vitripennis]
MDRTYRKEIVYLFHSFCEIDKEILPGTEIGRQLSFLGVVSKDLTIPPRTVVDNPLDTIPLKLAGLKFHFCFKVNSSIKFTKHGSRLHGCGMKDGNGVDLHKPVALRLRVKVAPNARLLTIIWEDYGKKHRNIILSCP